MLKQSLLNNPTYIALLTSLLTLTKDYVLHQHRHSTQLKINRYTHAIRMKTLAEKRMIKRIYLNGRLQERAKILETIINQMHSSAHQKDPDQLKLMVEALLSFSQGKSTTESVNSVPPSDQSIFHNQ